jgi:hypothetical protein
MNVIKDAIQIIKLVILVINQIINS